MSGEIFFVLFFLLVASLFSLLLMKKKKMKYIGKERLPIGPKPLPIIGNLHHLGKLPHRSLKELSKIYGDLMFLRLGSVPTLVVSSADMAREIFKEHDLAFSGRPSLYAAKKLTYNLSTVAFAPYGEYWREIRKIAVLELLTVKRIQSFVQIRDEEVGRMIDSIAQHANKLVNVSQLSFSLLNNVVCRVAFGTTSPDNHANGYGKMTRFQEILLEVELFEAGFNVADYFPWLAWINKFNGVDRKLDKIFRDLDWFVDKAIEEHRDSTRVTTDHEDIIDVLLRIQKEPNKRIALDDKHIKGVLVGIFSAGTDTSSATIEWTMTELVRNPKVKERVQQEVRTIFKGKDKIEENDLQKLTYLKLVVKESLRLHPPAPLLVPRETIENCTIAQKYEIPAKTRVMINASAIGTDPMYWKNPEQFCPERFLDSDIDFRGQHFELLPFGSGRRGCPGINFALSLVELALVNLLFFFNWELPEGMLPEDIDMEESLGITMHKKISLCLIASPARAL
ncbi:strychnine-11-hydroxylase-like [Primulina tabacum]|uniref:strychnine-11-hydroxylase-like n=1 Tax=Primulina tabacum TaxID=48773 RepID=UPI003F5ADA96